MYINKRNFIELMNVALGEIPADLVVKGGKLVNVYTGEIYPADVAVKGSRIACIGKVDHTIGNGTKIIDATGKYLVPGMIEMHQHVAGSQLGITEFAKGLLLHGTTAILTDFYEIGIVGGPEAIKFCLNVLKNTPVKVFYQVASQIYIQNGPFGNTGKVKPEDLKELLALPECFGISEWPRDKVLGKDPVVIDLIQATLDAGKAVIGHCCEMEDPSLLNAYTAAGASSDHEAMTVDELIERQRLGIRQTVREGTAARDLLTVIKAVTERKIDPHYLMFCTDEDDPSRTVELGHSDRKVRMAISQGVNPVDAIRMATLSAAEYLKASDNIGSITPGRLADIVLVDDLASFGVEVVIANGELVVENGKFVGQLDAPQYPEWFYNTVNLKEPAKPEDFEIYTDKNRDVVKVRVIGQKEGILVTETRSAYLKVKDGAIQPDIENDVIKIAYLERHQASGRIGKGFVQGFNLKAGAIASTFNPQCENILVIGTNNRDMTIGVNRLAELGGGFVVVKDGEVLAEVPLPLLGLMSDRPIYEVIDAIKGANKEVQKLGCPFAAPFTQMAFIGVPIEIGTLKISEYGLVDVWKRKLVDVVIE